MSGTVSLAQLMATVAWLSAWLGAALVVATTVARAAFAVLPTRALAGALVGRVLPAVFLSGIAVGIVAALLGRGAAPAFARARLVLPLLAALCCAVAQFGIAPRIQRVRAEIGPAVEALPETDARRVAFGRLHAYSVAWLGAGMLCAGATLVLSFRAVRGR